MQPVVIRPAQPSDAEAIAGIYRPAVVGGLASFELQVPNPAEIRSRMAALTTAGFPYITAEIGGTVVGYAYAGSFRTRPAYRYCVEDSVYVAKDAHGLGVGSALLGELIAQCEHRDFRQMIAVIAGANCDASVTLHRRFGFEKAGTLKSVGYKQAQWLDTIYMQRALGSGASTSPTRA